MVNNVVLSVMAWATSLRSTIADAARREAGQDIMEYAILGGAIALIAGAVFFGGLGGVNISAAMQELGQKVQACITFDGDGCQP